MQSIHEHASLPFKSCLVTYLHWDHCSSYCHGFGDNCATVKNVFAVSVAENIASVFLNLPGNRYISLFFICPNLDIKTRVFPVSDYIGMATAVFWGIVLVVQKP